MSASKVEFDASVWQRGDRYVVKMELVVPTAEDADVFARWLVGVVKDHVVSHGGMVFDTKPKTHQRQS
jgi:hypothetical protein